MPTFPSDREALVTSDRLPVLPLRDVVVFPYVVMPLLVGRAASLAALEAANEEDRVVLLVAQRDAETQEPAAADLYRVGVVARIRQLSRLGTGTVRVLIEGVARARVTRYVPGTDCLRAVVEPMPAPVLAEEDEVLLRRTLSLFEEYVALHRRLPAELVTIIQSAESPARQAFGVAAHLGMRLDRRQALLAIDELPALLRSLGDMLTSEIDLLKLERKIDEDVRGSLFQNQREFYLQEQLKAIHRELGSEESEDGDDLSATLEAKGLPEPVAVRTRRELRRLRRLAAISPEAGVVRTYLDWIAALPWRERTDDVLDVAHARRVLDEDHYGLEDVKERVLDYIGVLSLVERLDGPILCLVGPPGVGKTSLGRSIARAMGRRFVRMSLGGVRDEAEIRGHRRTYIGAMPGRVIQAMRRAEVVNPVILLDEVDKLGSDYRGDPSAALLEVLDPEQNKTFNDHYLEIDYDLSQVLFITTANSLAGIPDPLRDRMEIIRLAGYLDQEKYAIARQFLLPRQLRQHGIEPSTVTLAPDVVPTIVHAYTREAGVRELERRIARVARKLARARAERRAAYASSTTESAPEQDVVQASQLYALLGVAPFDPAANTLEDKIGVATGLAYTSTGGDVLEIEVSVVPGRGRLQLTGTLGDVMKESASAALSYARARAGALGLEREFLRSRDLHVHIPAGATPKDGPSAGIAIACAIVSALSGIPLRGDVAMTGEITLRGRVLGIGGLKEKTVAALRNRVAHIILPQENARDLDELPAEVKAGIQFHPVRTMDEVLAVALARAVDVRTGDAPAALVTH
ncbi:MAG: endopeptidase La [Gemmatimonadetes bacterium]|nr:MAG: endopeptidase La [Gemmatimonadota bacterium]